MSLFGAGYYCPRMIPWNRRFRWDERIRCKMGIGEHRWRLWHLLLLGPTVLLILAPFDVPAAQLCYSHPVTRPIVRSLGIIAYLASNGVGVLAVLIGLVALRRTRMRNLPRVIVASLGAGLIADIVKLCVWRDRPHSIDLSTATFSSTFHGALPFLSAGSRGQSFPSGHAATAIGLATIASLKYPRGRWLFLLIAAAAAVWRVIVHAHFPTDVAAGAMIGAAWAVECSQGFLDFVFLRIERKLEATGVGRSGHHQETSALVTLNVPPVEFVDREHQSDAA